MADKTLDRSLELILEAHAEVVKAKRKAFKTYLEHAIEAGAELKSVKEKLGHGPFMKWIKDNCMDDPERKARGEAFSDRTARDYMACANNKADLEALDKPARS